MSHEDCLAILVGSAGGRATGPAPAANERREAEEHVARCSDCWAVLSLLHELAAGGPPPGSGRMGALFGCGPVQGEMYLLAGLTAGEIRTRHPDVARHLGWCHACRERLAEVMAVERAAARGELGPALVMRAAPRWKEAAVRAGETVRAAVGRVVIQLRRAGAVFTAVPEGFLVSPMPLPAAALRGSPPKKDEPPALGQKVEFPLPDSDVAAELTLQPHGPERVGLALRVAGGEQSGLSVRVREIKTEGLELVSQYLVRGAALLVLRGLTTGQYVLEIEDTQRAQRFQLRFDIEAAA
ncbi:MAG TPA: hypothetical protein VE997_00720 [Candidatus Limnocylindria bacterium]|nr:hypothetical protein [Candidatus Limnocylindria bacterium]